MSSDAAKHADVWLSGCTPIARTARRPGNEQEGTGRAAIANRTALSSVRRGYFRRIIGRSVGIVAEV